MPKTTPDIKVDAVRALDAEVVLAAVEDVGALVHPAISVAAKIPVTTKDSGRRIGKCTSVAALCRRCATGAQPAAMVKNPEDRSQAIRPMVEGAGGRLHDVFFCQGGLRHYRRVRIA